MQCDVSKKIETTLVPKTVEQYGTMDMVVNNAGVNHSANFFDTTEQDWDWVMSVDPKGTFLLSEAAARVMVAQKPGVIINVTSVMAQLALADQVPDSRRQGRRQPAHQGDGAGADRARNPRERGRPPGPVMTELMERVGTARRSTRC